MKILTVLAMAGAVALGSAAPALADHHRPGASLKITVAVEGLPVKHARLTCGRAGGSHPTPKAACKVLRSVRGNPARLTDPGTICTKEYRPHTVTVRGRWYGKRVDFTRTFGNGCLMTAEGRALYKL
ncbi:SSI family serine proteinase inhibitor [Nonomuraea sp. NPDC050310]|uniref:SSI family serine proteinase inhibitor n=1 Tax=unclassified Nonomuraea TaxID=2593643 RepID=UPI0033E64970